MALGPLESSRLAAGRPPVEFSAPFSTTKFRSRSSATIRDTVPSESSLLRARAVRDILFARRRSRRTAALFASRTCFGRRTLRRDDVADVTRKVGFDKQGRIASRMNGFLPETFVEQLTERIAAALRESAAGDTK